MNRTNFRLNLEKKMAAPLQVQRLTGVEVGFILELENKGQFCKAKSLQSLNGTIFKNYLKEARWSLPMR